MGHDTKKSLEKKVSVLSQILETTAQEDNALGFMAREFILANLPHSNPKEKDIWIRENGNYKLIIQSSAVSIGDKNIVPGIPYGPRARLILLWLTSEAKKNNSPVVHIGRSFSEFLKNLDFFNSGGKRGDRKSIGDQIQRILSCKFSFTYSDAEQYSGTHYLISSGHELWSHDLNDEKQENIIPFRNEKKESYIRLSAEFFELVKKHSVPVDVRVLNELSQSPLAMDLYCWLTYRVHGLKKPVKLTWYMLQDQFGADYKDIKNFSYKLKNSLMLIKKYYSELDVDFIRGGIILNPSSPHVKKIT